MMLGADPTALSYKRKWFSLHFACANAAPLACIHLLMGKGALWWSKHRAAAESSGEHESVEQLKNKGLIWALTPAYTGDHAMHLVVRNDQEEEYDDVALLSADTRVMKHRGFGASGCGARGRRTNVDRWAILHRFAREGEDLGAAGCRRETPLHIAAAQFDCDLLRRLTAPPPRPVTGASLLSQSSRKSTNFRRTQQQRSSAFTKENEHTFDEGDDEEGEEEGDDEGEEEEDAEDGNEESIQVAALAHANALAAQRFRPQVNIGPLDSRGRTPLMLACISTAKYGDVGTPIDWLPCTQPDHEAAVAAAASAAEALAAPCTDAIAVEVAAKHVAALAALEYDPLDVADTTSYPDYDGQISASIAVVQSLLRAGANPTRRDGTGVTALMYIATSSSMWALAVAKVLIEWGGGAKVDVSSKKESGDDLQLIEFAPPAGSFLSAVLRGRARAVNVNARDASGKTALMWAAEAGATPMVELLLSYGADASLAANIPSVSDHNINDSHFEKLSSAELIVALDHGVVADWSHLEEAIAAHASSVLMCERSAMVKAEKRAEAAAALLAKAEEERLAEIEAQKYRWDPSTQPEYEPYAHGDATYAESESGHAIGHDDHHGGSPYEHSATSHVDGEWDEVPFDAPHLERRYAPSDGHLYTLDEFIAHYGGTEEWETADHEFPAIVHHHRVDEDGDGYEYRHSDGEDAYVDEQHGRSSYEHVWYTGVSAGDGPGEHSQGGDDFFAQVAGELTTDEDGDTPVLVTDSSERSHALDAAALATPALSSASLRTPDLSSAVGTLHLEGHESKSDGALRIESGMVLECPSRSPLLSAQRRRDVLPFIATRSPRAVIDALKELRRADTGVAEGPAGNELLMLVHTASIFAQCHGHTELARVLRESERETAKHAVARALLLRRNTFFSSIRAAMICSIQARKVANRAAHHAMWEARHALFTSLKSPGWAGVPDPWSSQRLGPSFRFVKIFNLIHLYLHHLIYI